MKKWKKRRLAVFLLFFLLLLPGRVSAAEEETYLSELTERVDFSGLDEFLEADLYETKTPLSFSDMVEEMLKNGVEDMDFSIVLSWVKDALFFEIESNRKLLIEVLLLAVGFSVLKNFAGAFQSPYVSDLCFILVYCVLVVMLLHSFAGFKEIASEVLTKSVEFMQVLIPTFCITMVFAAGAGTSAGFYQTAFLVIYLIQWVFLTVLIPMIHIYVLLELMNHFFEEEKFANLTELLRGIICWGMKLSGIVVLGLNVVQGLVNPAKDKLLHGTVSKAATMIPGVGNVINGVSELLLGSGIMIKNCVGAAALIILVLISLIPMIKICCMVFFYKLAAAVAEPVADGRIAGCLKGMAQGGVLYLKLMGYCLVLLFLTIALTTAVSGFVY